MGIEKDMVFQCSGCGEEHPYDSMEQEGEDLFCQRCWETILLEDEGVADENN